MTQWAPKGFLTEFPLVNCSESNLLGLVLKAEARGDQVCTPATPDPARGCFLLARERHTHQLPRDQYMTSDHTVNLQELETSIKEIWEKLQDRHPESERGNTEVETVRFTSEIKKKCKRRKYNKQAHRSQNTRERHYDLQETGLKISLKCNKKL